MTNFVDSAAEDFAWGPHRRFGHLRPRVSQTTLRDWWPAAAITLGAVILVLSGVLVWTSYRASAALGGANSATGALLPSEPAVTVANRASRTAAPYPTAEPEPIVIVHVSGQVADPGIVEIPLSARVFHAIEAAGGALPDADLDRINLAADVIDGSQFHIPPIEPIEPIEFDASPTARAAADEGVESLVAPAASASPGEPESLAMAKPETGTDAAPATTADTPTEPWQPAEPNPIPPEIEALLMDRETAPDPEEIEALLEAAGLGTEDS